MNMTITGEQRNALYEQIIGRAEVFDDLLLVVSKGDFAAADRLAWEHSDNLRVTTNDLGWGEGSGEAVELTSPPDVLRRFFTKHLELAADIRSADARERAEGRESEERNQLVIDACTAALVSLSRSCPDSVGDSGPRC
jgi:hypothetical protein